MMALARASKGEWPGKSPYGLPYLLSIAFHVLLMNWNKPDADDVLAFAAGLKPDSIATVVVATS